MNTKQSNGENISTANKISAVAVVIYQFLMMVGQFS
jgi:hypothetical protein